MLLIVVLCFSLSLSLTYTHTHTHTKEASQNVKPVSGNSKRSMGITGTFETKRTWSWLLLWESKRGQAKEKRAESEGARGRAPLHRPHWGSVLGAPSACGQQSTVDPCHPNPTPWLRRNLSAENLMDDAARIGKC